MVVIIRDFQCVGEIGCFCEIAKFKVQNFGQDQAESHAAAFGRMSETGRR